MSNAPRQPDDPRPDFAPPVTEPVWPSPAPDAVPVYGPAAFGWQNGPDRLHAWPPQPEPDPAERTAMARAHWIGVLTHWVGPLVTLLTAGKRSAFVWDEAAESLNWEITVACLVALSVVLMMVSRLLGLSLLLLVVAASVVLRLHAASVASRGMHARYPVALRLVR
ncbi:DUF4870 domain-containing protein [Nigerium massiliense]|uniref:DUF4870 domain-containing protein n=1 Tax=Nigerium massiliense TaxID=1522317 RepID=UPI000694F671|nr:DUF4870 domain-containing protein [Nigerium massiliense]